MKRCLFIIGALLTTVSVLGAQNEEKPYNINSGSSKWTYYTNVQGNFVDLSHDICYGGLGIESMMIFKEERCIILLPESARMSTIDSKTADEILIRIAIGDILCNKGNGRAHFADSHSGLTEQEITETSQKVQTLKDSGLFERAVMYEYPIASEVCFTSSEELYNIEKTQIKHVIGINAYIHNSIFSFKLLLSDKGYSKKSKYVDTFLNNCISSK